MGKATEVRDYLRTQPLTAAEIAERDAAIAAGDDGEATLRGTSEQSADLTRPVALGRDYPLVVGDPSFDKLRTLPPLLASELVDRIPDKLTREEIERRRIAAALRGPHHTTLDSSIEVTSPEPITVPTPAISMHRYTTD